MQPPTIRLLLVEDNPGDVHYVRECLSKNPEVEVHHVDRLAPAIEWLAGGRSDAVLLDLGLPDSQGLDTLRGVIAAAPGTPVVVYTGHDDGKAGALAFREGAQDYLVKGRVDGDAIMRALRYSLERKRVEGALELSNRYLQVLNGLASDLVGAGFGDDVYALVTGRLKELTGGASAVFALFSPADRCLRVQHAGLDPSVVGDVTRALGGKRLDGATLPLTDESYRELLQAPILQGSSLSDATLGAAPEVVAAVVRKLPGIEQVLRVAYALDGELFGVSLLGLRARSPSLPPELLRGFAEMVALSLRRKRVETERELLATAIDQVAEAVCITDAEGVICFVNSALERTTGYTSSELIGQNPRLFKSGEQDETFYRVFWETLSSGMTFRGRMINRKKDGTLYTEDATISPVRTGGRITSYVAVKRDVTKDLALEAQLLQAQKMEGVGQLAGGVAHDFNNLLCLILSYTDFALEGLPEGDPLREDLQEVKGAAERAAVLTHQLLAFSRKQVLQPVALNLNEVVTGLQKMLGRIVGEDIELKLGLAADLDLVMADWGQLDQVIVNLVVNARDAMPEGGKLTVETDNVEVDEEYSEQHLGTPPGPYVRLSVSDSGAGMDEQTRSKIFDPFFTTKEKGRGTGLGLSTVYGIVTQSGGRIWVYSEPGRGTAFKIYFPRTAAHGSAPAAPPKALPARPSGHETILVVEDVEALRRVAKRALETVGYRVLTAGDGEEGLAVAAGHSGAIDLLLTDVVMPKMSGRVLAQAIVKARPTTMVLYMSGYTGDAIVHHGVLDAGTSFLAKPFTADQLARKVREVLQGGSTQQTEAVEAAAEPTPPDREALAALPEEILRELRDAVLTVRYDELVALVEVLRATQPELASGLRRLADLFDYEALRKLLGRPGNGESGKPDD